MSEPGSVSRDVELAVAAMVDAFVDQLPDGGDPYLLPSAALIAVAMDAARLAVAMEREECAEICQGLANEAARGRLVGVSRPVALKRARDAIRARGGK